MNAGTLAAALEVSCERDPAVLDSRRIALLLVLAALITTALVALALPELRLVAGLPLPSVAHGEFLVPSQGAEPEAVAVDRAALIVLLAGVGLVLVVTAWRALRGVRLRSLGVPLLPALLAIGGAAAGILLLGLLGQPGPSETVELLPPPPPAARSPLGPPPSPLLWFTAAGLVLASALAAGWMLRPRRPAPDPLLARLALEAEQAQAALAAGEDARAVILACYGRMTAAVAEERGIERPGPMTAREFGEQLGAMGFPRAPVGELTALFEASRYGRRAASPAEEARALACLAPIVDHCRDGQRGGAR